MVDHDHDRVKFRRRREISDEVNGELSKGERDVGFDWEQRGRNRVGVSLVLLADRTAGDEVFHEGGETWPPVVPFQECFGMKNPIYPEKGEEWMEWSRAERAEGGTNM